MIETTFRRINWSAVRPLLFAGAGFLLVTGLMLVGINLIGMEAISGFIEGAGIWAPLAFIAIKMATYVFAPLTSGPIQLSAGVLFGFIPGAIYTLIGEVLGGCIAFLLSRRYGKRVVRRLVGEEGLVKVEGFVEQIVDWRTLTYARLFLFSLYDFISYAVGFSKLRFTTYVLVSTFIGIIPTLAASYLGTLMAEDAASLFEVYALLAALCVIPLLFQRQIRRIFGMK
jgi:uncharacterized membrane protein YdjX (TVP38/TMEM64 family)